MITYKVVLDERRAKADGKFPIIFRITFNRKTTNYASGIAVGKGHWNSQTLLLNSSCLNYKELNQSLSVKFLKVQKLILQLENSDSFSFEAFKELFNEKPKPLPKLVSFSNYSQQLINQMINDKRAGNAYVYQTAVNRVLAFSNNDKITVASIDYFFIEAFTRQLQKDGAKPNTIGNYLRSIRAIWNKAIKAKVVDRALYPFLDIPIKTERTAKRALSLFDVRQIYRCNYKRNTPKWHARNYFLLSFSLRGASFIDMAFLTKANHVDEYIKYRRQKTESPLSIKLLPITKEILSFYQNTDAQYLLPVFKEQIEEGTVKSKSIVRQWIKTTNKWLKHIAADCGIEADITTYVTRHTWATAAKRLSYSNELIAECLGHSYGNKITNIYLDNFERHVVDSVNQKVVECILPCARALEIPFNYVQNYKLSIWNKIPIKHLRLVIS